MQDLSHILPGGPVNVLTPTSQQGGNQIVSNELAMTAPGSVPSSPATSMTGEELNHKPPVISVSKPPPVTPAYTTDFESVAVAVNTHAQPSAPVTDYTDPTNGVDAGPDSPHPGMDRAKNIQAPPWKISGEASGRWKNTPSHTK